MAKNRLLANDASPSIGGFVYQVHLTIERWLNLQPEEILNLERGEDIDLVSCSPSGEEQVRLEQVKNYTSNVTLRSAVNYIAYFIEHRQNNSTKNLFFRYTTTSKVGTEQDLPEKLKKIPGIFVWEQIRQGCLKEISQNEALHGIRDILSRDVKKKPDKLPDKTWKLFCDFVKNASDDDILNLISRFEWRTEALELKLLIKNILNLLIEKQSEIPDGLQAQEQYERLFFYVFHLLSQPGLKQLSVEERNTQLNRRLSERESQEINSIVNQSISELERIKRLEELSRESRAWCIERFRVAILSRDEAVKLADDPSIGAPPPNLRLRAGKVILLTGEFGVGKTLIAQRLFQDAIKQACENVNAPVPIYLEAWQWKTERPLKKAVEKAAQGLGDLRTQGAVVIIDELDEAVNSLASQVLSEAYRLAETWENTTVVITSRSIRCIDNAEEAVPVPLLSEMQAYALIERVSDLQITAMVLAGWSKPVKEAIRYPLFALLLGRYLRQRDTELPRSKGELLSSLIEDALEQVGANRSSAEQLLKRLAKLSVECGSGLVRATDVAPTRAELQPLLDSRLVVERLGGITFPLPILTQWFAAQSLADGTSKVEDFVNVPQQLENWRYPLIIATATFGSELVSKLLTPITQRYPAFASEIMNEGLVRRGYTQEIQLPPPDKCEQQIRMAMQAWARGIGPLAELIAPVRQGGKLLPIRARTDGVWLETAWYVGNKNIDVVELPPDWDRPESQEWNNWASGEGSRPGHQSAWAWRWAIDTLVSSLSRRLEAPTLPVSDGCLTREAAWRAALAIVEYQQRVGLTKRSLGKPDRIPFAELEKTLFEIDEQAKLGCDIRLPDIGSLSLTEQQYHLKQLSRELEHLRSLGQMELYAPWPGADEAHKGGWPWELYSLEQLRIRAEAVYKGALDGYQQLVSAWFPQLAPGLQIAAMLPARLVGVITPPLPNPGPFGCPPAFNWYLEALSENEENDVQISISEHHLRETHRDRMRSASCQLQSLRPKSAVWIRRTPCMGNFPDGFFRNTPATAIAYSWLWRDLRKVYWVDNILCRTRIG